MAELISYGAYGSFGHACQGCGVPGSTLTHAGNDLLVRLRVADVAPGGAIADVPGNSHQRSPISSGRAAALPAGVAGQFQRRRPADDG